MSEVREAFDPAKETPLEYNRRHFPETVDRIERLLARCRATLSENQP